MALIKKVANIDVLTAARLRIKNIWSHSPRMYLSFSSGKDSLCCAHLLLSMAQAGEIDISKLTVNFIDEEGLYPSMVRTAEVWREKFLLAGAKFNWYCLPFKQVCTLDGLSASESWITWEPGKEDVWMRTPPPYAIVQSNHIKYAGEMNYQTFLDKACADGITIVGLRTAESYTRLQMVAQSKMDIYNSGNFYPIYDWTDNDIWLYIKENQIDFPEVYMRLYEAGVPKRMLRLSAFFGDKTTQGLRWVAETDPDLWERIERRMPNAYLVMLYWDSEMFARSTRKRGEIEADSGDEKNYKEICLDMLFKNPDKYRIAPDTKRWLTTWRRTFIEFGPYMENRDYRKMYECILAGDPKGRDLRSFQTTMRKKMEV